MTVDTINSTTTRHVDVSAQALLESALARNEGVQAQTGALVVETGSRTGRSPKDRFIVHDDLTAQTVDWGPVNQPIDSAVFKALWDKVEKYLQTRDELFISHLQVGADADRGLPVKVVTELAWHNLFAQHLFIDPSAEQVSGNPGWEIHSAPGFFADPKVDGTASDGAVILNFSTRQILICGIRYAGEMKKAMFTAMNFLMPEADILPMHCAANVSQDDVVTLFFGLSGTGKTTLSAEAGCMLIGDDEHGWATDSVFNFEGGCYAKCIALSEEQEPEIWTAVNQTGAVLENVYLDANGKPDFDDDRFTQNTRGAYARSFLPQSVDKNRSRSPSVVLFLACDCYGVLPPIASLTKEQAAYYFLSGYTALMGSTEVGSTDAIKPTFSTCFGAPFFPRPAQVYADLLMRRVDATDAQVYLINTGWTGGAFGQGGNRFSIAITRQMVRAARSGEVLLAGQQIMPGFGFKVPLHLSGVDTSLLNPIESWNDSVAYKTQANALIQKFQDNFRRFSVSEAVAHAGPEAF